MSQDIRTSFLRKLKKSVVERYGGLTMDQRQDMMTLIGQGIDAAEARAIVQGYDAVRKDGDWDESKHPRADNGEFGSGGSDSANSPRESGAPKLSDKDLAHKNKPFNALSSRQHFDAAREADKKAERAKASGNAKNLAKHAAVAQMHRAAGHKDLADEKQNPATEKEIADAHSQIIHAYGEGGTDLQAKLLAGMKPSVRNGLDHLNRAFGRIERAEKSAMGESARRDDYAESYLRYAKAMLPDWQHAMVHRAARGSAGGLGKKRASLSSDQRRSMLFKELEALRARKRDIHAEIGKMSPLPSEVHVPVPLGGDTSRPPKKRPKGISVGYVLKDFDEGKHPRAENGQFGSGGGSTPHAESSAPTMSSGEHRAASRAHREQGSKASRRGNHKLAAYHDHQASLHRQASDKAFDNAHKIVAKSYEGLSERQLAYIQAAYAGQTPVIARTSDDATVPADQKDYLEANRLVAGMDHEFDAGAQTAEEARRRASRLLRERPGSYDNVGAPPEVRALRGLMLDLGPGESRARGWLGVDLRAHDHGTVLHDLEMGLPFDDESVRAVRMHNSLGDILSNSHDGNPLPLLSEIQRVLMPGGRLYYAGDQPIADPDTPWALPGLVLEEGDSRAPVYTDGLSHQTFRRVPFRVGAYHAADATYFVAPQADPTAMMAQWAMNEAQASTAMANLVHKQDARGTRVVKADAMRQILTCVVLSPVGVDTQGDLISARDIEDAAHDYMKSSRVVGADHGRPIDASVVESYIAPQSMKFTTPEGPQEVHAGDWVISLHIACPDTWAGVLDGSFEGVSVGGVGEREPVAA